MTDTSTSDHQWPHWPTNLHYHAKGHGAYPFWSGGGSDSGTADLEVWWSEEQRAEKFYHSSCTQSYLGTGVPCYHLMKGGLANAEAYLYTADERTCCISQPSASGGCGSGGPAEVLAAPASDWMDLMTYGGEIDFTGDFYSGKVKKYTMVLPQTEAVDDFWYYTTPEGIPVQQGEGGMGPPPAQAGRGHRIWHDYNQDTFDTSSISADVYAVPAACETTTLVCAFP